MSAVSQSILDRVESSEPAVKPLIVGRYTIYQEIAAGGMAAVHFARLVGPSGFARTVVVKRPHAHLALDRDLSPMFIDEARLAARIHHPNVVSTLDVVQTPTDLLLVMDYVHGESLSRLTDAAHRERSRVSLPIAASIVIGVLHGLQAAHDARGDDGRPLDIVHRDVSPQNILVGADGIARLVDFGIAKATGRLQKTTRSAAIKGKLGYMAPEQVRGEPVSRATDTFAAAIVLWELLTGQRLFDGETAAETVYKTLFARVKRAGALVAGLPSRIDEILHKGLTRDPARRYRSAQEMADDIEACVPPIRGSHVAAWVERLAGDALARRTAARAAIESMESGEEILPTRAIPVGDLVSGERSRVGARSAAAGPRSTARRAILAAASLALSLSVVVASGAVAASTLRPKTAPTLSTRAATGIAGRSADPSAAAR
jgi:serine/threonine-protein kinase